MPYLKEGSIVHRKDGRYAAFLMLDNKWTQVAICRLKKDAHAKLKEAIEQKEKNKHLRPQTKVYTLFSWLDHWHNVFRLPKMHRGELSENTILGDQTTIRKIKKVFKDIKLRDVTAAYIQEGLNSMTQGRSCESVFFILKMALGKAKSITGHNIMELVEQIKHSRISGRALDKEEIKAIIDCAQNQTELDIIDFYLYTGCRPDELTRMKIMHINLTDKPRRLTNLTYMSKSVPDVLLRPDHIFLDGTKNPLSQRCMPIFPQLRPVFERLCKGRGPEESLFDMNYE